MIRSHSCQSHTPLSVDRSSSLRSALMHRLLLRVSIIAHLVLSLIWIFYSLFWLHSVETVLMTALAISGGGLLAISWRKEIQRNPAIIARIAIGCTQVIASISFFGYAESHDFPIFRYIAGFLMVLLIPIVTITFKSTRNAEQDDGANDPQRG